MPVSIFMSITISTSTSTFTQDFHIGIFIYVALAVLGFLSIVMPQIEKRFNFSSFDVGMIAAANDVPAVIFGLIISHYGNFGNKVKWIGLGGIVTGNIYIYL